MSYKLEFALSPDVLHLNHAGVGPWPRRSVEAIRRFAEENLRFGSLHYAGWNRHTERLREMLRDLIGASSAGEIALTKNTSEGISLVACGLDWHSGDNVVVGRQEFPSNRIAWEVLAQRHGVEVRLVDLESDDPEAHLIAYMDAGTRLLAVSSIQYASGCRLDLARLSQACKHFSSLFCVDAIQSLGAFPFNAQTTGADFVCADGHKWLLGPEGTGIFYCRRDHIEKLKINQFGWHMTSEPSRFDESNWRVALDARRFECGSLNHLGFVGLAASIDLFNEVGIDAVAGAIEEKISYLIGQIDEGRFEIVTPRVPDRRGGILTVRSDMDNQTLFSHLSAHGVLCAKRAGGIRLSPHFYTPRATLDCVLELLHEKPGTS